MKSKEFLSTQAVLDAWAGAIEAEFGTGRQTATLERLAPVIAEIIESPAQIAPVVVEFGYQYGDANIGLGFTMRCLELLASVSNPSLASALDTRDAAVLAAEGWNSGMIGRLHRGDDLLTPMSVFLHVLQQCYISNEAHPARSGRRVVLVVVDMGDVVTTRGAFERLRNTTIAMLRSVWSSAHPISEGSNGNLVVMVGRDDELHASVGRLRRLLLSDTSIDTKRVHVWIEPLSDSRIHLDSHLQSLVGPIESPPELLRRAG
ncbi:MAG: hypothetical protein ABIR32_11235 [Ilumatobacteraceae bacterium]